MLSQREEDHFHRQGFVLIPNPLPPEKIAWLDSRQQAVEAEWASRDWPQGFNKGACQFLMMGDALFALTEEPQFVEMARSLLDCKELYIGACGLGDASKTVSADGRPQQQVHWHADGGPQVRQVSLRTALDRHSTENAPLRILPGSHKRARDEVEEELRQLELATGEHDKTPELLFTRHPLEVEVKLDPRWILVWTPSCWHATGVKTAPGRRRAMAWNYVPPGGRTRDKEAVRHIYADVWQEWSDERKKLWSLV